MMSSRFHSFLATARISLAASLAVVVPMLVILPGLEGCLSFTSYLSPTFLLGVVVAYVLICLVFEIIQRRRHLTAWRRVPWFFPLIVAGAIFFPLVGPWVKPLVLKNPAWCSAQQSVEWGKNTDRYYVLMLHGEGNTAQYKLKHGYLNWVYSDRNARLAGSIPIIRFQPTRFGDYYQPDETMPRASVAVLRERIRGSGLQDDHLESVVNSIQEVLQQIENGKPISSETGEVSALWISVENQRHHLIGNAILLTVLVVLFLIVGHKTLRRCEAELRANAETSQPV